MKNPTRPVRLAVEACEPREVPAFLAPISSPGGGSAVAAGDVNHDGRADIAVVSNNSVAVSLSNGDGTFQLARKLSGAKGYYRMGFGISDANHDGHLDVVLDKVSQKYTVVTGTQGSLYYQTQYSNVWLGNGDGTFRAVKTTTFTPSVWFPTKADLTPTALWGSDLNRDGIRDFVSLSSGAGALGVELGNGDDTFQPPLTFAAGPNPVTLAAGDFNGDGWTDVIVVNNPTSGSPTLSVLLNDGTW